MKPLYNFREDSILLRMHLKLIKFLEVVFVYWFVSSSCEMYVSLVSATPLINGIFNLRNNISNTVYKISIR